MHHLIKYIVFILTFIFIKTGYCDSVLLDSKQKADVLNIIDKLSNGNCDINYDNVPQPLNPWLFLWNGQCFEKAGDHKKAIQYFEKVQNYDLPYIHLISQEGILFNLLHDGNSKGFKALKEFQRRYPEYPYQDKLLISQALYYDSQKKTKQSNDIYKQLFVNYPHTKAGCKAESILKERNLLPADFDTLFERAKNLLKERWLDDAYTSFNELLNSSKTIEQKNQTILGIAETLIRMGKSEKGCKVIFELPQSWRKNWGDVCLYYYGKLNITWRGKQLSKRTPVFFLSKAVSTYLEEERFLDAKAALEFIPLNKRGVQIKTLEGWIDFSLGNYEKAAINLAYLKGEYPWDRGRALYWQARAYQKAGSLEKAKQFFGDIIKTSPTSYYGMWAHLRLGEINKKNQIYLDQINKNQAPFQSNYTNDEIEALVKDYDKVFPNILPSVLWLQLSQQANYEQKRKCIFAGTEELQRVWLQYSSSTSKIKSKLGLESLWRGRQPVITPIAKNIRIGRAKLDSNNRKLLAKIALNFQDFGLAFRFAPDWEQAYPYAKSWEEIVNKSSTLYKLPPEFIYSIMRAESRFRTNVISVDNAIGLMQLLPRTAKHIALDKNINDFSIDLLFSPFYNIDYGSWYLSKLNQRFKGQIPLAIAAYNGGAHNVSRWVEKNIGKDLDLFLEKIPFSETRRYVRRVLSYWMEYSYNYKIQIPSFPLTLNRIDEKGVNY